MKTLSLFLALLAIAPCALAGQTQPASGATPDEWRFTVAPYLMLPWMDGKTAVRGVEVDVNVAPSEIFSNLQFGAMGAFEARKSRWGFGVDAIYMALGTTVERDDIIGGDRPNADVDFNQGAYTFQGLRQLNDRVDFVFGARWNVIQGRIGLKGPNETVVRQTEQWVDPIVGLKFKQRLGGPVSFTMQGDIGGFGAGSDFAWQLFPVVGIDVGSRTTLGIGYRVLGTNYTSGSDETRFQYDVITQAFVLGAAFHF
jgi:hypothetical protein